MEDVQLERLRLNQIFDAHEGLNEQRLSELHIDVKEAHHRNPHKDSPKLVARNCSKWSPIEEECNTYDFGCFLEVVVPICRCHHFPALRILFARGE